MDTRLLWLALAAFVGATEGGLIAGLLPLMSADLGVSQGQVGLVVLGYSLAYAIGTPLLALLLGSFGRRRILAGAEFSLGICALGMAMVPAFEGLVAVRTVLAVAAGTFTGTAMATAAMIAPTGQRGRYMQVISFGQSLASLVGVPAGAFIATQFGWRVDYWAIGVMALLASAALWLMLPKGMPGDTTSIAARLKVLRNPGVGQALASTLLLMTGAAALMVFVAALGAAAGVGTEALPLVLLAGGVGALICSLTAGRLADRLGSKPTGMIAGVAVLAVMLAFLTLPHLPDELALSGLMVLVAAQGYVGWTYAIAVAHHMAQLAPGAVPVAISLNMSSFQVGMAVAAAVGGIVVDSWGAMALPMIGAPLVVVALIIWRTVPDGREVTPAG